MKALTYALALLAALRATRFVTQDWLGEWTLVGPAKRWAAPYENVAIGFSKAEWEARHEGERARGQEVAYDLYDGTMTTNWERGWEAWYGIAGPLSKQARLVKGLDCPFCVGFWLTGAAVLAAAAANRGPRRRATFQVLAGAFGANYLTGHISKRLDS
ncbi:hypothetical protein QDA03_gp09 [Microbacterium phage Terij]|uniref:DUF1360 domain-containing protein n=1 Tax=Microbacterium phage Terij TaxID=2686229 RepID=A0A6B9LH68_9CAUD|nr:hypothetical protein QDA03_gp09 [Microbacterium phage Terij]QHB37144.1 hypothetical protein SEA_TERIJ_9 [Microbacterium phage Terij]